MNPKQILERNTAERCYGRARLGDHPPFEEILGATPLRAGGSLKDQDRYNSPAARLNYHRALWLWVEDYTPDKCTRQSG